jgi:hypothetical protein
MKNIFYGFWAFTFLTVSAQGTRPTPPPAPVNCSVAVSNAIFQQRVTNANSISQLDRRLNNLTQFVSQNCVSSSQVKQLALLLADDYSKGIMALAAYPQVIDKDQFYDVYDAFASFSGVMRLYDEVSKLIVPASSVPLTPPIQNPTVNPVQVNPVPSGPVFPDLPYPSVNDYLGNTGCSEPMLQSQYDALIQQVWAANGDANRVQVLRSQAMGRCMSVAQAMRLSTLVQSESSRLEFARAIQKTIYDSEQYNRFEYVFSLNNIRNEFLQFLRSLQNEVVVQPVANACSVSGSEMNEIIDNLMKVSFDSSRLNQAKSIVRAKKCFTVSQITDIARLMSFDSSRLDFAKFAYDFCLNPTEYFKVNDIFSFNSSKNDLTNYVNSKR